MPIFVLYGLDGPKGPEIRKTPVRQAHLDWLQTLGARYKAGSAMLADDGVSPIGSVVIIEAADYDHARATFAQDPYQAAGIWDRIDIRQLANWAPNTNAPSATELFSGTKDVVEAHRFDEGKLEAWMKSHVEGYQGPLTVRQFKGGQSNPTYQLITPNKKYVMRRKPPGKLLPSAHAVDREFRVISALHPLGFPVAKPYALCEDDSVIGTMFYIMDMVEGRILWDATLPDYEPAMRRKIFEAKLSTFAWLHNVDWRAAGLEGFGKEGDYIARQIHRWTKQYKDSETTKIPEMDKLIEWLPKNVPPGERTSIVHGDYRIDNMVLHPTEPKVIAVLDWELSTLGDPLADFTYHLMSWEMPSSDPTRPSLAQVENKKEKGIPTREEYVARYCELTGRQGLPELDYYFAYNAFRLAGIIQGIVGRVRDGTASNAAAAQNEGRVAPLAKFAYACAQRAGLQG